MEQTAESLKQFIIGSYSDYLDKAKTEDTPMPHLTDKTVILGVIDPLKINSAVCCSILPETETEDTDYIGGYATSTVFTVTFLCKNNNYDVLIRQMCRYAEAFREAVHNDYSLNCTVNNTDIGERRFYPDCGTNDKQMTACEIELTIYTTNDEAD